MKTFNAPKLRYPNLLKGLALFVGLLLSPILRSQVEHDGRDTAKIFTSLDEIALHPELVYRANLSKQRLTEVPSVIFTCTNLTELVLDKNRLIEIPLEIGGLKNLRRFSAKQNKLERFPQGLLKLEALEFLDLGDNWIDSLPDEISHLQKLHTIAMWDNPIGYYTHELSSLPNLNVLDLLNNQMSKETQQRLKSEMPNCKIIMSPPCSCMDGDQ